MRQICGATTAAERRWLRSLQRAAVGGETWLVQARRAGRPAGSPWRRRPTWPRRRAAILEQRLLLAVAGRRSRRGAGRPAGDAGGLGAAAPDSRPLLARCASVRGTSGCRSDRPQRGGRGGRCRSTSWTDAHCGAAESAAADRFSGLRVATAPNPARGHRRAGPGAGGRAGPGRRGRAGRADDHRGERPGCTGSSTTCSTWRGSAPKTSGWTSRRPTLRALLREMSAVL